MENTLVIESSSPKTKAQAKEITNVVMQAGKMLRDPGRKVQDFLLTLPIMIGISLLMAVTCFLINLWSESTLMMICMGMMLVLSVFELALYWSIRKYYNNFLNKNPSVKIVFDKNGIDYNDGERDLKLSWQSVAFIRVLKENVFFFPTDMSGIIVIVAKKEEPLIMQFIAEQAIPVKIVK
ncbi:MAG: hypothetical protein IKG93_04500 [Clostridiales bacterium]|nr:hypothetical protein [Clostridiales bacterium]